MTGDAADLHGLESVVKTLRYGRKHRHFDVCRSTNDEALKWAAEGAPDGALVTADHQTEGRGRRGRSWSSPACGDLYASMISRPDTPIPDLPAIGLVTAIAIRDGLSVFLPRAARIKWPNDVLVDDRKIAGVLCETRWEGPIPVVVIGIGINVARRELPSDLADIATSVVLAGGNADRLAVLMSVLGCLEALLNAFVRGGFAAVRDRYEPWCVTLGRPVWFEEAGRAIEGRAESLEPDGALCVRVAGGLRRVDCGDVHLSSRPLG